jgi:putative nucleotidyltransferase with HDIG domain
VLGIQLMVVIKNRKKFSNFLFIPILLFTVIPLIASIIQVFFYGISLTNIASIGLIVMLYIFSILDANTIIETAHKKEVELLQSEYEISKSMLIQTAEALASAIDAKDSYTNGHSKRVAEYSVMLAKCSGKTEEECEKIRIIALLHDIGKIGIPDDVINKKGRLTDEEFEKIKEHPTIGYDILSKIKISPELSIGAHYHHERYDGKGYPDGLKGDEIPEVSRLIAVADSYDAMTSKRSYRDSLPQEIVRDEIIKGIGTQFDPTYAWYMIRLIDQDKDYQMRQM